MMFITMQARDKFVIGSALFLLSLAAWISTYQQSHVQGAMVGMSAHEFMPEMMQATAATPQFLLFMPAWIVMMAAMMLPSAAPMIMTFAAVAQQRRVREVPYASTGLFVLGYLLAWSATGLVAYAISTLQSLALPVLPELKAATDLVTGATLIIAGVYQFSMLKQACLAQCRAPIGYVLTHWREGNRGAVWMGWHHGIFCIGCCWALMAILFVVGIMNLAWMMALTLFMFVEKASASGQVVGKLAGVLLVAAGMWTIAAAIG